MPDTAEGVYIDIDCQLVWIVFGHGTSVCYKHGGWVEDKFGPTPTAKQLLTDLQLRDAFFILAKQEDNAA